jgi:hypothetical protein
MAPKRTCRACGKKFDLIPGKPGNINDCPSCSGEDVPLLAAKVAWSGKHQVEIEITSNRAKAQRFNRAQRRHGATTLSSIVASREGVEGRESSKSGSGAGKGDSYNSRLGEKHTVKS